jgi:4-hydroxy-tetrahydrodipicolinate synthase
LISSGHQESTTGSGFAPRSERRSASETIDAPNYGAVYCDAQDEGADSILMDTPIRGLFAAVATPVRDDGTLDGRTFDRLVAFLVAAGVDGICIGGATGEYPHFEAAERKAVIGRAAAQLPKELTLLVGIGSSSMARVRALGEAAIEAGSRALLLPMPMFFRYEQSDLHAYCAQVSGALRAPCLLYDLPSFTNGLAPETVLDLLRHEEFIVGIKDSGGRIENLATFASARDAGVRGGHGAGPKPWTLLVGDDGLLQRGLDAGWDGGISGVAGFCPELLVALYRTHRDGGDTASLQGLLDELIGRLAPFPTPWGIRIGLAARGLPTGPLPLPLTAARERQIADFVRWVPEWLERTGLAPAATIAD